MVKHDFPTFIARSFGVVDPSARYEHNWHIDLIAEYLEAVRQQKVKRLIINMPPRALKSVCVSVAWPAWLLGHRPSTRIMTASYSAGLSVKHALDTRHILNEGWYQRLFPELVIAAGQNEKHKLVTTQHGFRLATSVGGTATGEGGDILIVDDPLHPLQAISSTERTHANNWFDQTFSTRLNNKKEGGIVVVMQRLHPEDLSGHLLAKGGWEHLCLPAKTESSSYFNATDTLYHRPAGLLHNAREDEQQLADMKITLGSFGFAAQYQQEPMSQEGGMVKMDWFVRYDMTLPDMQLTSFESIIQSWDTAIKTGEANDATVCITMGVKGGVHYVLDVVKDKLEYPSLKRLFYRLAERFSPDAILIEDKASGQSLLQDIKRESSLAVIGQMPKQSKLMRFAAVTPMMEAERVALPKYAHWLSSFEEELIQFPHVKHDDQVDALTQYLGWVKEKEYQAAPSMRRV